MTLGDIQYSGAVSPVFLVMPGLTRHPLQDTEVYHGKPDGLSGRYSRSAQMDPAGPTHRVKPWDDILEVIPANANKS